MFRPALLAALLVAASAAAAQDGRDAWRRASPATARVAVTGLGHGSGFVADPAGLVVTCYHMIEVPGPLEGIGVELPAGPVGDGTGLVRFRARVVAADGRRDAIVLAIEAGRPLSALELAPDSSVETGDPVHALGHPTFPGAELPFTMTSGTVSFRGRILGGFPYLQTDAPIHAGMSGGPLVDRLGRAVGLVAIHSQRQPGIAFALPVEELRPLLARARSTDLDPAAEEAEVRRVAGRWLGLLADRRPLPAAALLDPFYSHDEVALYQEMLALVRGGALDAALRREFGVPHSARLLEESLRDGVDRPAIQRYLVELAAESLGVFEKGEVVSVTVEGALADARVRLDDRELAIRLVREEEGWFVVPYLPVRR